MSMFRRPTEDSSDSSSASDESETEELDRSNAGTEEIEGPDLAPIDTVSSGESISIDHSQNAGGQIGDIEHVRSMMLASLLEDFYRARAAELFNTANPGSTFHRQSVEVQPLAQTLFREASQALSSNGLLPSDVVSTEVQSVRGQYLSGFDQFGLQNIRNGDLLVDSAERRLSGSGASLAMVKASDSNRLASLGTCNHPVHDLALRTKQLSIVPSPQDEMRITSGSTPRSHYRSSFQELRLLGRGGFGRVYQTYNVFDQKEYAVKKIPLSVKQSQRYRERGHAELASVLREVQALAQLDHCNVVRYHATWIEDPTTPETPSKRPSIDAPYRRQKLIANTAAYSAEHANRRRSSTKSIVFEDDGNIVFEADTSNDVNLNSRPTGWSRLSQSHLVESSVPDSDIFTDGQAFDLRKDNSKDDPTCYVLHVQMSMYPQTLAHYLSPAPADHRNDSRLSSKRHCFHLIPALRIIFGILCGLQYIHSRGLIHRDIKPSNIFLSSNEFGHLTSSLDGYYNVGSCPTCPQRQPHHINPRIGDFGLVADLARQEDSIHGSGSLHSGAVGTEYYRPPLYNSKKHAHVIDERIDVYALGVIFVELLWQCRTSMERLNLLKGIQKEVIPREIIKAIEQEGHATEIVDSVEECIKCMIQRDRARRWDCAKVKERLERILISCGQTAFE